MHQSELGIGEMIGVVDCGNRWHDETRGAWKAIGIRHVLRELGRPWVPCRPEEVDRFGTVLLPLMSVTDQIAARRIPVKRRARVIAGGQGAYAIRGILDRVDDVAFGRAEGICDAILSSSSLASVWRKAEDESLSAIYEVRQAQMLLHGEVSIGCNRRCKYCQYTWTRSQGDVYRHPKDLITPEITFAELPRIVTRSGRYTTALDGFSEDTRRRVRKGVTRPIIARVLRELQARAYEAPLVIKVFQIVGYPWETEASVAEALRELRDTLASADVGPGRVVIMMLVTPFSPEPLTPMECEPASWIDWHRYFDNEGGNEHRSIYHGRHLEVFVLPQVQVPWTLARRAALNRCESPEHLSELLEALSRRERTLELERIMGQLKRPPCSHLRRPVAY